MLSLNQPLPGLMSLSICYPLVIPVAIHIEALGLTKVTSTRILGLQFRPQFTRSLYIKTLRTEVIQHHFPFFSDLYYLYSFLLCQHFKFVKFHEKSLHWNGRLSQPPQSFHRPRTFAPTSENEMDSWY